MSAYVVSFDTLDLLVTAALEGVAHDRGLRVWHDGAVHEWRTDDDGQALGQMWHEWNVDSVNYRYHEHTPADSYRYRRVTIGGVSATLWDVIASAECLNYQSCELPTWTGSLARAALMAVRDKAVGRLMPDSAAWGWTRDTGSARVADVRSKLDAGVQ